MLRLLAKSFCLLTLLAGCKVPPPPLASVFDAVARNHPAVGCWELSSAHGSSPYLPGIVRIRLDTALVQPDTRDALMQVHLDSGTIHRMIGRSRIFIAHWGPYRSGERVFVFWGDGLTGLDMRLRVRGDQMSGPSANVSDTPMDTDGPEVVGHRVACD